MRTVIPSSTDWLTSADFNAGTVLVEGRLAEMLHPELWRGSVGAWNHALDPRPWDYSGNGNHASRIGGVIDRPDGAWVLNGTTGYLDAGTPATLNLVNEYTICGWIRNGSSTGATRIICAKRSQAGQQVFGLNFPLGNAQQMRLDSGEAGTLTAFTWQPGELADFAVTRSGTTLNFYKAAVLDSNSPHTKSLGTSEAGARFLIGAQDAGSGAAQFWDGTIYTLALYDRVLSQPERAQLAERPHAAYECRLQPRRFFMR